jgi:hypothetical protein
MTTIAPPPKRRWKVDFFELAYDGGGMASWSQWYRTKVSAYISMYWNVYVSSWGGDAELYDYEKKEIIKKVST